MTIDRDVSTFRSAQPIWPAGREKEMNLLVGFRAVFPDPGAGPVVLRIAAWSLYRVFLNGCFIGHGPARGPHDDYRIDEWALTGLQAEGNVVAVEVAGYNVNNFYLVNRPSFLQAEILCEDRTIASTAGQGIAFQAAVLDHRVRKSQRCRIQRTFVEHYRLRGGYDRWRNDPKAPFAPTECAIGEPRALLPRRVPYPDFGLRQPVRCVCTGRMERRPEWMGEYRCDTVSDIGPEHLGYPQDELELVPLYELQGWTNAAVEPTDAFLDGPFRAHLDERAFAMLDFGRVLSGLVGVSLICRKPTRLFITFYETLAEHEVGSRRTPSPEAVTLDLAEGEYEFESLEPYTWRFLRLLAAEGDVEIRDVRLRQIENPQAREAAFACSDPRLERLFEAARATFAQNAVDLFTDCPSRERAGWLCDSFFTARVAPDLCGNTVVERNFLENYLLPESFEHHPAGMLPMCYPADHYNGNFIPNWAMWLVLELEEYLHRSGDRAMIDAFEPKVTALVDYFEPFRNEFGLLEKLKRWVFIEWSRANDFVQDVNYPSNMLYAGMLDAVARLYGRSDLAERAAALRQTIREKSFDGEFFTDNATRCDGKLEATANRTEVCQYFAFFFDVATPDSHPVLWDRLVRDFGPARRQAETWPDIHVANAFIGNYLRIELLSRYGLADRVLDESLGYFLKMADLTGTLWEMDSPTASCNHGFASHVAHSLIRDVLGLRRIDPERKTVTVRFNDLPLDRCRARVPLGRDAVELAWWKESGQLHYRIELPADFRLAVENHTNFSLHRQP